MRPCAAEKQREEHKGDVDEAIKDIIETHVRLAGAQGFLTNIGGLVTMTVMVPANIAGLALIQCRMVAAIAHLRGYDLDDQRVRNAILASLLGEERMLSLIRKKKLPGHPDGDRHGAGPRPAPRPGDGQRGRRPS